MTTAWARKCQKLAKAGGTPIRCTIAGSDNAYTSGVVWEMPNGTTASHYAAGVRTRETEAIHRANVLYEIASRESEIYIGQRQSLI